MEKAYRLWKFQLDQDGSVLNRLRCKLRITVASDGRYEVFEGVGDASSRDSRSKLLLLLSVDLLLYV